MLLFAVFCVLTDYKMDEHKRVIQECVNKVAGSKNFSVISKDKYDKVVTHLVKVLRVTLSFVCGLRRKDVTGG